MEILILFSQGSHACTCDCKNKWGQVFSFIFIVGVCFLSSNNILSLSPFQPFSVFYDVLWLFLISIIVILLVILCVLYYLLDIHLLSIFCKQWGVMGNTRPFLSSRTFCNDENILNVLSKTDLCAMEPKYNGKTECGIKKNKSLIAWPAKEAGVG